MSLSPQVLLSKSIREKCIANFKDLPIYRTFSPRSSMQYASVLIPLCVRNDKVHVLYTLRSSTLKSHSGQVSFPGGKMDGDESIVDTALRETEEEIGVPRDAVDIWTIMPDIQGLNKDLIITPVIGELRNFEFDKLAPNKCEVEDIFTVPIDSLCNTNTHAHCMYGKWYLPLYFFEKHKIWGTTGFITHMFLLNFLPRELYKFNFNSPRYEIKDLSQSKL